MLSDHQKVWRDKHTLSLFSYPNKNLFFPNFHSYLKTRKKKKLEMNSNENAKQISWGYFISILCHVKFLFMLEDTCFSFWFFSDLRKFQ